MIWVRGGNQERTIRHRFGCVICFVMMFILVTGCAGIQALDLKCSIVFLNNEEE